jgi:hypothetical protein
VNPVKAKYLRGAVWQLVRVQPMSNVTHFEFQAIGMREHLTIVLHSGGHVEMMRRYQFMSLKPERRAHISSVAHQMQAITVLTPDGEKPVYPAVKLL